jgi:hypothetical protein
MTEDRKRQMAEEINELITSRHSEAIEMYPKVRDVYRKHYDWPEMDTLRHEVCTCLVFGLYQAALTLTNHMLESLLKFALSYKDALDSKEPDNNDHSLKFLLERLKPSFELYDNKDLSNTINRSCTVGLITKNQKKELHNFRELLRNPYSHAEKKKIHADKKIPVQCLHLDGKGDLKMEQETNESVLAMPFLHGMAQYYHAKAHGPLYFLHVDALVREIIPKVFTGMAQSSVEDL